MLRLIDADAFLEYCKPYPHVYQVMRSVLKQLPIVDAVPVRHGKWTPHEEMSDEWNCSETWYRCQCGYDTRRKTPYCPMCGARMDVNKGEKNE